MLAREYLKHFVLFSAHATHDGSGADAIGFKATAKIAERSPKKGEQHELFMRIFGEFLEEKRLELFVF